MRIETPTWVNVDHPTYHSISLNLVEAYGPDMIEDTPTMTVRALGSHPALLLQLEQLLASTRFSGDWTARLWGISPVPRFGNAGAFIVGWREGDDDTRLDAQIHAWTRQVGRAINAIHVTWACFQVPAVKHLIDLTSPSAPPSTLLNRKTVQIAAQMLIIHSYQYLQQPPIRAAYDSETHTLYCLT